MAGYRNSPTFLKLKQTIEDNDTKGGKRFDFIIETFIILSLISFSIETIPRVNPRLLYFLNIFNITSIVVFTVEYLMRIFVADRKLKYIYS